jgi:hypothetical protein
MQIFHILRVTPRHFILFVTFVKSVVSRISLCRERSLICLSSFYIQLLHWSCLSGLGVLWWNFWGYLHILSYHLQIVIFWLFPFQVVSPWSPFVVEFLWLELQVLFWIGREEVGKAQKILWKRKREAFKRQRRWRTPEQGPLNQHDQCSYEPKESEAACMVLYKSVPGPLHIYY